MIKNSQKDTNWQVFKRCALGENNQISKINISNYSPSSSLFDFTDLHLQAKKNAEMIGNEQVEIIKLDSLENEINLKNKKILIKIDTQGYEAKVLSGAKNILNYCKIIICEVSFKELYKDQKLWTDIINIMILNNFKIRSIENGFFNESTNELLQADMIFIKND